MLEVTLTFCSLLEMLEENGPRADPLQLGLHFTKTPQSDLRHVKRAGVKGLMPPRPGDQEEQGNILYVLMRTTKLMTFL